VDHDANAEQLSGEVTGMDKAKRILDALGGADNILDIEPCITRLRTEVRDPSLVDDAALKAAGAIGVLRSGGVVQVVVGPEADTLASDIEELLE
jgi:N-acetylglucosamine PTS system EIIB component